MTAGGEKEGELIKIQSNNPSGILSPVNNRMYSTGGMMCNRFDELRFSHPTSTVPSIIDGNKTGDENVRGQQRRSTGKFQSSK